MEKKTQHTQPFLRKRKFLLVLPLLVLPFVTLLFWAGGGGKGHAMAKEPHPTGLNVELPDAQFKEDDPITKLQLYEQAEKRAKERGLAFGAGSLHPDSVSDGREPQSLPYSYDPSPYLEEGKSDVTEAKVYQKLEQLNRQLQSTEVERSSRNARSSSPTILPNKQLLETSDPLPELAKREKEKDPELEQLNAMMDKILDIQHPERVKENARPAAIKGAAVYTVTKGETGDNITLLGGESPDGKEALDQSDFLPKGFYSLEEPVQPNMQKQTAIGGVVHQTQTLEPGATILVRLTDAVTVNGLQLPKGLVVYGTATLDGERLQIRITNIRSGNELIPVRLKAYDLDGIEGLFTPGVRNREAANGTTQRAVQGISLNTFGLSPGVQAAGVGVEAAKNLIGRKVKAVRVRVQQGHQLLLQNE